MACWTPTFDSHPYKLSNYCVDTPAVLGSPDSERTVPPAEVTMRRLFLRSEAPRCTSAFGLPVEEPAKVHVVSIAAGPAVRHSYPPTLKAARWPSEGTEHANGSNRILHERFHQP